MPTPAVAAGSALRAGAYLGCRISVASIALKQGAPAPEGSERGRALGKEDRR